MGQTSNLPTKFNGGTPTKGGKNGKKGGFLNPEEPEAPVQLSTVKKPLSSYILFSKENTSRLKVENPGVK